MFKKSAQVSPTVVASTLMIQKKIVSRGTLFNIPRAPAGSRENTSGVGRLVMAAQPTR
jgi:hypothetical protein